MTTLPNNRHLRDEAADPATAPARLQAIAEQVNYRSVWGRVDADEVVREALAANPSSPLEVLQQLAGDYPDAFIQNPMAPFLTLERPDFLNSLSSDQLLGFLVRAETPPLLIGPLVGHPDRDVRESARLHVQLVGDGEIEWEGEARRALSRLPVVSGEALVELAELDLTPFWVLEQLAGGLDQGVARRLLPDDGSPERRELLELLRRAERFSGMGPEDSLNEAEFHRLANGGVRARCLAARHPDTPPELLAQLTRAGGPLVRKWAAWNPALPVPLMEELSTSQSWRVRVALARNPAASAEVLHGLTKDPMVPVRAAVARNPGTPPTTLERLSYDACVPVCAAVARNPHAPASVLLRLSAHPERSIRLGVKANPAVPPEALALLESEPTRRHGERFPWRNDNRARRKAGALARERSPYFTPARSDDSDDGDTGYSDGPLPVLPPDELLHHGLDRQSVELRKQMAGDPRQPYAVLEVLAGHRLPAVRAALAANPNAPASLLARLASDPLPYVLNRVATHPHTTLDVLVRLVPRVEGSAAELLARSAKLPPELLEVLAGRREESLRLAIARHPRLPAHVRLVLAGDPCRKVRRAAAQRAGPLPGAREHLDCAALRAAAGPDEPLARFFALADPRTDPDVLAAAVVSLNWIDRLAATLNPGLPSDLRERLMVDANQVVRSCASAPLAGRPQLLLHNPNCS